MYSLEVAIPARSLTNMHMWVLKSRIMRYARQNGHLPADVSGLPSMPGYGDEIMDASGRPIEYSFDSSGIVTLRSLGADKQAGGNGDDRGMTGVFASRDATGHWQDEMTQWTVDPMKQ